MDIKMKLTDEQREEFKQELKPIVENIVIDIVIDAIKWFIEEYKENEQNTNNI